MGSGKGEGTEDEGFKAEDDVDVVDSGHCCGEAAGCGCWKRFGRRVEEYGSQWRRS